MWVNRGWGQGVALFLYWERRGEEKVWSFWAEDEGGAGKYLQPTGAFHICICQIYPLDRRTACAAAPHLLSRGCLSIQPCRYIGRRSWKPSAQHLQRLVPKRQQQHMSPPRCVALPCGPHLARIDTVPVTCPRL